MSERPVLFPPKAADAGLSVIQDGQVIEPTYQYHSYSGTDMLAFAHMPQGSLEDYRRVGKTNTEARDLAQTRMKTFAELQTLTVSSARNVAPVRRLGESHVNKYTRGARTIAGTLIFAILDRDVFGEFYRQSTAEVDSGAPFFVDQIPEFHIFLSGENEYGGRVSAGLLNITLTNFGQTVSVDDIYIEATYTYVAQFFLPFVEDYNTFLARVQESTDHSKTALSSQDYRFVDKVYTKSIGTLKSKEIDNEEIIDKVQQKHRSGPKGPPFDG